MSKIGLDLRLVKKINEDLWVHHDPITYDVYRANWKILRQCSVDSLGGGMIESALSANMLLFALDNFASKGCEKVYSLLNVSDEEIEANHELSNNVEFKQCRAFINTLIQRTNVVTPLNGTYANLPLLDSRVKIGDEDMDKIIGNILFFTSWNYAGIPTRTNLLNLIDCQESLLSCVEFQKSLQKSIVKESTKATAKAG